MTEEEDGFDLTPEQEREIKQIGYAHFRHAQDDMVKRMALLRAAALTMSEAALYSLEPAQALEAVIDEVRDDALQIIAVAMGVNADEITNPIRKS